MTNYDRISNGNGNNTEICKMLKDESNDENNGHGLSYEKISHTATYLCERTAYKPKIGIICGSGLGELANLLIKPDIFQYDEIPNFPVSTVTGHKSRLLIGLLEEVPVMVMQGRFHAYEGHSLDKCTMCVRVMKLMGIETLIVTNAAGGLNPDYRVGDVMLLKDHVNIPGMAGKNPLRGPNEERFGERFFGLNNCYDKGLRKMALKIAKSVNITEHVHEGVYAYLGGPNYETVAELRMLHRSGVDAVGMSTVPEVIVARHCKIRVFSFSLITNECIVKEETDETPNHAEVLQTANQMKNVLRDFVRKMIIEMREGNSEQI
uniref:Purine nucleoside phosphorylase n=1 Tax=Lepeophtheirus salmonis TaxID=72036 RepID=D3PFJ6_LEPSM|nr:Purine nucleoside phosphorylase [Lepeophtheirus salmonis]